MGCHTSDHKNGNQITVIDYAREFESNNAQPKTSHDERIASEDKIQESKYLKKSDLVTKMMQSLCAQHEVCKVLPPPINVTTETQKTSLDITNTFEKKVLKQESFCPQDYLLDKGSIKKRKTTVKSSGTQQVQIDHGLTSPELQDELLKDRALIEELQKNQSNLRDRLQTSNEKV